MRRKAISSGRANRQYKRHATIDTKNLARRITRGGQRIV